MEPNPELIVAIASAVLSIASGLLSTRASLKARAAELGLERQQKQEEAADTAERILNQYREPLIAAAHTLQGRLYNIVEQHFLLRYYVNETNETERSYARDYTVYAIAEYLTWVEILRREMRFHDLRDRKSIQQLMQRLDGLQVTFQRDTMPAQFRVFRGRQRAIAEVMMVPTNAPEGPRNEPMGYAAFSKRLTEPEFASWFAQLQHDVDTVAQATREGNVRLIHLQRDLIDLMDSLDPEKVLITANREKLPLPEPGPAAIPAQVQR